MRRSSQVVIVVCSGLAVVGGALAFSRRPVAFDDAFIAYRYAWNLVEGHGLVWNPGERVEGYTSLLWVLAAAAALGLGQDPFLVTRALGVASYLASIALVALLAARAAGPSLGRALVVLPIAAALVLPLGPAAIAGSGLETAFAGLLMLLLGLVHHLRPPRSRVGRAGAALLPLALVLTRPDALLAVAASAFGTLAEARWLGTAIATGRALARRFAPLAAGIAGWVVFKLAYSLPRRVPG